MPVVVGFRNEHELIKHFNNHGSEFGVTTKEEYFAMAKAFLEAELTNNPDILECARTNGNIIRFNRRTNEFGIVTQTGIVKTYFKPIPYSSAPPGTSKYLAHNYPNNLAYFRSQCRS